MSNGPTEKHMRPQAGQLAMRLLEPRRFIQVVAGPRQVGKTTLVSQVTRESGLPTHYADADHPGLRSVHWIEQQWEAARLLAEQSGRKGLCWSSTRCRRCRTGPRWSSTCGTGTPDPASP